jgi:hypothetical protein
MKTTHWPIEPDFDLCLGNHIHVLLKSGPDGVSISNRQFAVTCPFISIGNSPLSLFYDEAADTMNNRRLNADASDGQGQPTASEWHDQHCSRELRGFEAAVDESLIAFTTECGEIKNLSHFLAEAIIINQSNFFAESLVKIALIAFSSSIST